MFCPECQSEYRQGFKHCPSCDVELVAELPKSVAEPRWENADLVTVFVSLNPAEAALAKSALEGSGVEVSLVDDNVSRVESPLSIVIGGVKVVVPRDQEELALAVLDEFRGQAGLTEPAEEESSSTGDEEYRCVHCQALLEPETLVCGKCGEQPFE